MQRSLVAYCVLVLLAAVLVSQTSYGHFSAKAGYYKKNGKEYGYFAIGNFRDGFWTISCNTCHSKDEQEGRKKELQRAWGAKEFQRHVKSIFPKRTHVLRTNQKLQIYDLILLKNDSGLHVTDKDGRIRATFPGDSIILKNDRGRPELIFSPSEKKVDVKDKSLFRKDTPSKR